MYKKKYSFRPFQRGNFTAAIITIKSDGSIATAFKICVGFPGVLQIKLVTGILK